MTSEGVLLREPKSDGLPTPLLLSKVIEDVSCVCTVLPLLSKLSALQRLVCSTGLAREHIDRARDPNPRAGVGGRLGTRELARDQ